MSAKTITLPQNLSFSDWAAQLVLDLDEHGAFGAEAVEDSWQDWAAQFANNSALLGQVPDPYQFHNWQDWAGRLCQLLA